MGSKAPSGSCKAASGPPAGVASFGGERQWTACEPPGGQKRRLVGSQQSGGCQSLQSEQGDLVPIHWVNMGDDQHADYTYLPLQR